MKLKYIVFTLAVMVIAACEQEVIIPADAPEPPVDTSCEDAIAGSAVFTKFVAIGTSYSAGFQSGALYNDGQANSLPAILNKQFECVGATATFKQPSINTENGFNIFIAGNPVGTVPTNFTVLGKLRLKGSPPAPAPTQTPNDFGALPNPQVNPGFIYTGATNELNNFSVQAMQLAQIYYPPVAEIAGDWSKSGSPYFNPFYARFSSMNQTMIPTTLLNDYIGSLTNGGTFFMYWLGMDDVLLYSVFGADPARAPLTDLTSFTAFIDKSIDQILNESITSVKGVVLNIPDIFSMPHFKLVPYKAIPFTSSAEDEAKRAQINAGYAPYNAGLNAAVGLITQAEADARKIVFNVGVNAVVIEDESLTTVPGLPKIRQATAADLLPLAAGSVLGKENTPGDPTTIWGVTKALSDQYVIIPAEKTEINNRLADFNTAIKLKVDGNARIAFVDINAALLSFAGAGAAVVNGVTLTPSLAPPTGIYSEEGIHPNSRGYAFISNFIIDAINAKFGSTIPKANVGEYSGTALPQ